MWRAAEMKNNEVLPVMIGGVRVTSNGDGLYSLNDLHKASGGERKNEPHLWLRSELALEAIRELEEETTRKCVVTKEGRGGGTYVDNILLGMYASWISSKFHILVYKVFFEAMEEKAVALENENKKLTNFKDEIYRRESINSHLSKDYRQFDKDVVKSIKAMLKRFRWQKEVPFKDFAYSSNYGRSEVFLEAWGYMERNVVECINDTTDRDKQIFAIKSIL